MAVEPRCLIIQDVDTNEIVHLPVEIKEGKIVEQTQLISSILILDIDRLMSIRVDIHVAIGPFILTQQPTLATRKR